MSNERKAIERTEREWIPTKTPTKRAAANRRRLSLLNLVYSHTWAEIPMRQLTAAHQISNSMVFFYGNGIIKRKGLLYRWTGPAPFLEMAHDWCDYIMAYVRRRRDRGAVVRVEMHRTFDVGQTADKRLDRIVAALKGIYTSIHGGYRKRGLTELCQTNGLEHCAGRHLISRGLIDSPRQGISKWVGPPPDRELALWLFGMLTEHHRSIYRSKMEKKQERTAMIDAIIGGTDPPFQGTEEPSLPDSTSFEVLPSNPVEYWSSASTTWNANSTSNASSPSSPSHLSGKNGLDNAQIKAPNQCAE